MLHLVLDLFGFQDVPWYVLVPKCGIMTDMSNKLKQQRNESIPCNPPHFWCPLELFFQLIHVIDLVLLARKHLHLQYSQSIPTKNNITILTDRAQLLRSVSLPQSDVEVVTSRENELVVPCVLDGKNSAHTP